MRTPTSILGLCLCLGSCSTPPPPAPPAPVRPLLTSPDSEYGPCPTKHERQIRDALQSVVPGMTSYGICEPAPGEVTTQKGDRIRCWRVDVSVMRAADDGSRQLQAHTFWFKDDQPVRAQVEGMDPISLVGAPPR